MIIGHYTVIIFSSVPYFENSYERARKHAWEMDFRVQHVKSIECNRYQLSFQFHQCAAATRYWNINHVLCRAMKSHASWEKVTESCPL